MDKKDDIIYYPEEFDKAGKFLNNKELRKVELCLGNYNIILNIDARSAGYHFHISDIKGTIIKVKDIHVGEYIFFSGWGDVEITRKTWELDEINLPCLTIQLNF